MDKALFQILLAQFNDFLSENMGIFFPKNSAKEFEKKLLPVTKEFGFEETSECLEWLMKAPLTKGQIAVLSHHLTIGETYFFRDGRTFHLLEHEILPQIIQSHQKDKCIRIWSAACCTGEESYSIAILLSQLIPDIEQWDLAIFATDINHEFLKKAQLAHYKPWSFRVTSKEIQAKYFQKQIDGTFALIPEIKKMVDFSYFNLVEDYEKNSFFKKGSIDLIICNNVLIYFSHKQIKKTIHHLAQTLNQNGWLVVTPIEVPYVKDDDLKSVIIDGFTLFRKNAADTSVNAKKNNEGIQNEFYRRLEENSSSINSEPNNISTFKIELPAFLKLSNSILEINFGSEKEQQQSPLPNNDSITWQPSSAALPPLEATDAMADDSLKKAKIILQIHKLANLGQLDEANRQCEKALELDKLDPNLYYLQASLLQSLNDIEGAIKALKRVVYLDNTFIIAHFTLGILSKRVGNAQEAKRHLRNAYVLLEQYPSDAKIPGTDEMTVATLLDIVKTLL